MPGILILVIIRICILLFRRTLLSVQVQQPDLVEWAIATHGMYESTLEIYIF